MVEISDKVKKITFCMAIGGYIGMIMVILFYYFNVDSFLLNIFSSIFSILIFPIFLIMVLSKDFESSRVTREKLEEMDIDTFLKPFSNIFSDKPSWLTFGLILTLFYSFISFFYWMAHTPMGVAVIEHGEYFIRNHSNLTSITKEEFNLLNRFQNIGTASFLLAFYAISVWMLFDAFPRSMWKCIQE